MMGMFQTVQLILVFRNTETALVNVQSSSLFYLVTSLLLDLKARFLKFVNFSAYSSRVWKTLRFLFYFDTIISS